MYGGLTYDEICGDEERELDLISKARRDLEIANKNYASALAELNDVIAKYQSALNYKNKCYDEYMAYVDRIDDVNASGNVSDNEDMEEEFYLDEDNYNDDYYDGWFGDDPEEDYMFVDEFLEAQQKDREIDDILFKETEKRVQHLRIVDEQEYADNKKEKEDKKEKDDVKNVVKEDINDERDLYEQNL